MDRRDDAEDKRLMAALAGGEDLALNRLIQRWQGPLRSFVFRYVQNEADTDDLVQETFVRVYRHRARYRPSGRFSTWLFTIANNLCHNHAQKQRRRSTVSLDPPIPDAAHDRGAGDPPAAHEHASPAPGPAEVALQGERAIAVRTAIAELPPDLRSAILLFEYEELSHAEIAVIASTTPKAIETRLYRARQILRQRLARFFKAQA